MQKGHHKIQEKKSSASIERKKENTKFSLRLFKIVSLETEGYTHEQNLEYVRDIFSFKRLWIGAAIIVVLAITIYGLADGILWIRSFFGIPP